MPHLVLLGDSIFDNAAYVPGGRSVVEHLNEALPAGWRATLLAIDGSTGSDVARQLEQLPPDATHLAVSTGGNDTLAHSGLVLREPTASYLEALSRLDQIVGDFQRTYRGMIQSVLARGLPTVVCTIYDAIPGLEPALHAGLRLFNDAILREAFRAGVPVIDLRLICPDATDYSALSPIEPSAAGGRKIAGAIARAVSEANGPTRGSWIVL